MKQNTQVSRRRFLHRTAALAGAAAGVQYLPSLFAAGSPNSKLGVAVIGADGMGGYSFDCAFILSLARAQGVPGRSRPVNGPWHFRRKARAKGLALPLLGQSPNV